MGRTFLSAQVRKTCLSGSNHDLLVGTYHVNTMPLTSVRIIPPVLVLSSTLFTFAAEARGFFPSFQTLQEPCEGGGYDPTPTEITVTAVPIVVSSTTDDYFVLYVTFDADGTQLQVPVAVTRGVAGTTTLSENLAALPAERYRVEKYQIADPADVDGDCTDDVTELENLENMNPVNPATIPDPIDGVVAVPDLAAFQAQGNEVYPGVLLKFVVLHWDTARPAVYFMNTKRHLTHPPFLEAVDLRDAIKNAESRQWIIDALTAMHATYPIGQSLRYRSSTNNEDLPGFNGAGLYDSYTQHPEETAEDGIDKSFKQVLASLWTFRSFTEREFNRVDPLAAAMGVLVHPNFPGELVNGVAVSFDPVTARNDRYYVNSQVGEDLVTNPEAHSVPEELILLPERGFSVRALSNLAEPGELLMSDDQLRQLREHLEVIHSHFEGLYSPALGEPFAMEIELKITSENILAIKQARR